ncbi:hypothetical protein TMEC54S_00517 [Thauera mechernichensis]|jgi:hypothetical protein|uniref:Uncharacterized protein n=1 Tax=Aromatoleum aromaticum (strain DSM 19018 / LMG 30748 / EbN1) TaxID=76114 RepID=Q5NWX6_AROAE|nr:hypothetical protein [Aromatoleum aromaticum]CAI10438.1 hypothetical protein p1B252 [Aromatoleum aromaticum EbN1]
MDIETFTVELPGQLLTGAYVLGAWPREIIEVEVPFQPPTTLALDIFEISDKRRILVCTELACNQGRSITNSWPDLADHLFKLLGGQETQLVFIEHYCAVSYRDREVPSTYDLVDLRWISGHASLLGWTRLSSKG